MRWCCGEQKGDCSGDHDRNHGDEKEDSSDSVDSILHTASLKYGYSTYFGG